MTNQQHTTNNTDTNTQTPESWQLEWPKYYPNFYFHIAVLFSQPQCTVNVSISEISQKWPNKKSMERKIGKKEEEEGKGAFVFFCF